MINRAEPRACGHSRGSRRLDKKGQKRVSRRPGVKRRLAVTEGHRVARLASNRTGYVAKEKMWRRG